MSTEKVGLGLTGYSAVSLWLRFFSSVYFASRKLTFRFVVGNLMLSLGLLLSCSCPLAEREMLYVTLCVRRKFPKSLFLCLIGRNWVTSPLTQSFIHSCSRYLINTFHVPDAVSDTRDTLENKTVKISVLLVLKF